MRGCSIIICCYNAAGRLSPTLEHLAKQNFGGKDQLEILVVDNASTDETAAKAKLVWNELGKPFPLQVLKEPRQGKMHAIERGVMAARHANILFCDDDNWLAPNYLQVGLSYLAMHAEVGLLGGRTSAVADIELPGWFVTEQQCFAVGRQATSPVKNMTDQPMAIWGAGTFTKREIMIRVCNNNFPFILEDRKGESTASGGDVEIARRIALLGYEIHYNEGLVLTHYMSANRLSQQYLNQLKEFFKYSYSVNRKYYRQWVVANWSISQKIFHLVRLLAKYAMGKMLGNQRQLDFSKEYLFFLTGASIFSDEQSARVRAFYLACKGR